MFGSPEQQPESSGATPVAELACRETVYIANITSDAAVLLSDIMKTVFNITLNWCDKSDLKEVSYILCPNLYRYVLVDLYCRRNCMYLNVLLTF